MATLYNITDKSQSIQYSNSNLSQLMYLELKLRSFRKENHNLTVNYSGGPLTYTQQNKLRAGRNAVLALKDASDLHAA